MRFLGQFLISLGLCSLASAQRYFATIPKEVRNGMYYKVDVTLLRSSNAATYFDVSIWTSDNSSKLWTDPKSSEFTIKIDAGKTSGSDQIMVPYAVPANMECSVRIESRGMNPEISEQQTVKVIRPVPAIFIQTDKKIFKPSQEIRFRVLNTDEHLKPKSETLDVEIKDSKENVIFKKSSPDTNSNGMVEGHFKLSDDPILGTYKIIASTETGYTEETFRVEEYKLPKFEVTATCDPCYAVYNPDLQLTGSVSSMYTFGKQVQGRLSIKVFGTSLNAVEVVKVDDFDGSYDFDFGLYETIVMPYYSAKGIDFFQPYTAYSSITVIASVYEAYTEIEANTTLTYKVFPTSFKATEVLPLPFLFDGATEYSFEVKLTDPMENQLKTSDGQQITDFSAYKLYYSVNGSPLQANVTGYQQKLTVTEKYFSNIQVWYTKGKEESIKASFNPTKYYSGSKTGLTIALITSQNQTERCFKVEPFKTGDTVYFQVVNNYYSEEIKPYTNTNGHCFNVSSQHAPASLVLAYKTMPYMVDEIQYTEMLVASIVVKIPWSSNHQVSMTTADKSVKPGADVTVLFNTEPNSYVYVAGLDKSVALLAGSNDVTRQKLQDAVEQYRPFSRSKENPFPNPPWIRGGFMPLEAVARRKKRCIIGCGWHDHADGVNPTKVLEEAGLIMVTDLTLFKKLVEMAPEMAFDGRFQLAAEMIEDHWLRTTFADSSDSNNNVPAEVKSSKPESEAEKEPEPRKNFQETWLWNMVQTNNTGAAMLSANAPDTITSWLLNAYAFNAQVGLGVAPTVEVQVFQEFFMSMNLPYSIVRGEIFTLQILVFNYKDNDLDVLVTLNKANLDYSVLGPAQKQVKIPRQASRVAEFNVTVSVKVGTVLLLATAKDRTNSAVTDSVERELLVKPEGREVVRSTNLKMKIRETSEEYLNLTKLFDPEDMEDFVSGSLRMYLKVTGDMMGPVIENLEGNIRMPVGCGEQNIQTLTPGLFAGKYLKAINRLDSDAEKKIQEVCGYGYRKELIYKHADGSFSAFGEGPGLCSMCEGGQPEQPPKTYGSTWLTAYVLKMFSILKNEGFTYVSPEILYEMFNYLKGVQRPGCEDQFFVEQGDLIHKEMMGGSDSRIGFTAFCIAAILDYKSTLFLTDLTEKMAEVETVLNAAMTWMKSKISVLKSSRNAYQATVVAYTLAKSSALPSDANYMAARDLLDAVDSWTGIPESADSPSECIADKTVVDASHLKVCKTADQESWDCAECCRMPCSKTKVCQGRRWSYGTSGPSTTETSGYRLLADLALVKVTPAGSDRNKLKADAEKRQNELLSGMSYDGFWSSTMDTAVALEALSTFAIAYPVGEANFMIRAWSEGRAATETIVIKPNNFTINANAKLDILATEEPSDVSVRVEGSGGTAYVNLVAMYNVNSNVTQKAITITGGSLITEDGRTYLKSCVQADPLSHAAVGTMIVSEITLQSGMVFVNVEGGKDVRFAPTKIEMDKQTNTAVCYFMNNVEDNFMNERCCYVFYEQQFEVQNQKPGVMRARDYYQTEQNVEAFYSTSDLEMECSDCVTKKLTGGSESFRSSLTTAKLLMTMTMIWVIKRF